MKTLMTAIFVAFVASVGHANNVTDTLVAGQTPIQGDILYYNGVSGNTAGTWAQPSSIPGLTGATGAAGATGSQGDQGLQGNQGVQGDTGAKGDTGDAGKDGKDGADAKQDNGNGRLTANIGAEVRWVDFKHFALSSGYRWDTQHHSHTVDMAILQFKVGKSYEERELNALKAQVRILQRLAAR